jgi:predicted ATP-grasp superfamily ATP-dependent carboligase
MAPAPYGWIEEPGEPNLGPGSVLLTSFPSAGLAATVAAHYIVRTLKLPRIGLFDSPDAASVAVVQSGLVNPAIRMYGRANFGIVVSEFPPTPSAARPVADAILGAAEAKGCRLVVCLEGVVPHPVEESPDTPNAESVWVVLAREDPALLKRLNAAGTRALGDGVIGGVTGSLLVAGLRAKTPVAAVLVSSQGPEGFPDHRAGAALIEMLAKFLPELEIDTKPLRSQAELIERALRAAMRGRPKTPELEPAGPSSGSSMYQ